MLVKALAEGLSQRHLVIASEGRRRMIDRAHLAHVQNGSSSMISANVVKSAGHALIVGGDACRPQPCQVLQSIGYETDERPDPYSALLELCARPLVYRALVLSLQSLYRDELAIITTVRQRFPHISVWLAHTDGRAATLVEAMKLGAEALVSLNGVHSLGEDSDHPQPAKSMTFRPVPAEEQIEPAAKPEAPEPPARPAGRGQEPVLTADELHALLGD